MFDAFASLLVGVRFRDENDEEWITLWPLRDGLRLAAKGTDDMPAQVYVVREKGATPTEEP